ncbi:MAG: phosphopentomutase [Clostridia bacterium]|nr:phosphopentomutase [Clostridia bacterium]
MSKRVFLIVLDSLGIGELPDAYKFNDEGSNTLKSIRKSSYYSTPTLKSLGLFNIDGVDGGITTPKGSFAKMCEQSNGKDTTIGHWEIAGVISSNPLPTYPNGFPNHVISRFEKETGKKVLCNKTYSGTEVIKDYGQQHIESGDLIVYTSADSVFQIASHEDVISVQNLYKYCQIARDILQGKDSVGRVIARPFTGEYPFIRTANRKDFSLLPPQKTMLNLLSEKGYDVISVGKINDIFAGSGITSSYKTKSNDDGMNVALNLAKQDFNGLCFINLVDFDSKYGHRNDIDGYAKSLSEFDKKLKEFLPYLNQDDILLITADHGCDPKTPSTDHSREYTPLIVYGQNIKSNINLNERKTFADISATILDYFNVEKQNTKGESFLSIVKK